MAILKKHFDNASDFLEWASFAPTPWKGSLSSRDGEYDFTRTQNYEEAYDLAKNGWLAGVSQIHDALELINANINPDIGEYRRYDVAEASPHVPRAAAGDPFSMIVPQNEDIDRNRIIKLQVLLSYSAFVKPEDVITWGACLVACIDMLEQDGYAVEVTAIEESTPSRGGFEEIFAEHFPQKNLKKKKEQNGLSFSFLLKSASEHVNLSNFAFWLAHPSSLRRIFFSATERIDVEKDYRHGYGRPRFVTKCPEGTVRLSIMSNGDFGNFGSGLDELGLGNQPHIKYPRHIAEMRRHINTVFSALIKKDDRPLQKYLLD